jgi:hypothetical protein
VNLVSRLQPILGPTPDEYRGVQPVRLVRVVVDEDAGIDLPQVTLAPGDRLIVENRTTRTLRVAPLDFFGTAFGRQRLAPGRSSTPMMVTGLWFQVEIWLDGPRFFPLDVYLAPNGVG